MLKERFHDSMETMNKQVSEMTVSGEHPDLNFVYGMNLESQSFTIGVNITWYLDSMKELLTFAALYIAKDAQVGFDTTIRRVEALGLHSSTEAFWRVHGVDGVGMKLDEILRRNWLIPGAIDIDAWVVESSAGEKFNLPVDEGHYRSPEILNYFILRGFPSSKDGKAYALEVKSLITINPGMVPLALLRMMPSWALRKALGGTIRQAVKGTPEHVAKYRSKLLEVVEDSPATPFFKVLEQRIQEKVG